MALPDKPVKYHVLKSFQYASNGLVLAYSREPNLHIQLLVLSGSGLVAIFFGQWMFLLSTILMGTIIMALEMMNTLIEALCDLIHPEFSETIKLIKDISAGSVLIAALGWGILIFVQMITTPPVRLLLYQFLKIELPF